MRVLVPGTLGQMSDGVCRALHAQGHDAVALGETLAEDVSCGMGYVDNDVCVAAIAAVGQAVRWLQDNDAGSIDAVLSPEICVECRSVSMPFLMEGALERAGFENMQVMEFNHAAIAGSLVPAGDTDAVATSSEKPAIGVCGNTAVMATHLFNHTVVDHLRAQGCETVTPPFELLIHEQDFLEPCIKWFEAHGVRTVICILAFGCLSGHAYARGQAHKLRERYPHMDVTILDYDPSASDVNVVNRTELVIQAAKERSAQTSGGQA